MFVIILLLVIGIVTLSISNTDEMDDSDSKGSNRPGCEGESVAVFETLMKKETETTIVYLSAFYCINI